MPRNTGGVRSRPNFRPGGSNYTNTSYNEDLDCRVLHAFGSIVCNGEQRVQGNIMSGGMHVDDSGLLKVPVVNTAPNATTPADHPNQAGLVMVDKSSDGKMYFSREDGLYNGFYNIMIDAQDEHAGAVAARDAVAGVVAATGGNTTENNTADLAAARAAIDALTTGNTKFEEGVAAVRTVVATNLATSKNTADGKVTTLNTAKGTAEANSSVHGPFEWAVVTSS